MEDKDIFIVKADNGTYTIGKSGVVDFTSDDKQTWFHGALSVIPLGLEAYYKTNTKYPLIQQKK